MYETLKLAKIEVGECFDSSHLYTNLSLLNIRASYTLNDMT